jgi:hypothetical protein
MIKNASVNAASIVKPTDLHHGVLVSCRSNSARVDT